MKAPEFEAGTAMEHHKSLNWTSVPGELLLAEKTRPETPGSMDTTTRSESVPVVLSFDVEEHHRIEAAAGLEVPPSLKVTYGRRMREATEWILEQLAARGILATFFVVGEIAETDPRLVRTIHEAGHEVACHGWNHQRIHVMDLRSFREDVRRCRDALEQVCGKAVVGYRAPTFSIVRQTAWALDVLADLGFLYDSSIYPVRHDRYGIPDAPRTPFLAHGANRAILELPPATVRIAGLNVPVGGGGYFRLLPLPLLQLALLHSRRDPGCRATVLYFHPWEFDPDQPRLHLKRLSRLRTYVGLARSRSRFVQLLPAYRYTRAVDLARQLSLQRDRLPSFHALR